MIWKYAAWKTRRRLLFFHIVGEGPAPPGGIMLRFHRNTGELVLLAVGRGKPLPYENIYLSVYSLRIGVDSSWAMSRSVMMELEIR